MTGTIIKIVIVILVLIAIYDYMARADYKKEHAMKIQQHKERPPVRYPECQENFNNARRVEELKKWNREHPKHLLEGPCNESRYPILCAAYDSACLRQNNLPQYHFENGF